MEQPDFGTLNVPPEYQQEYIDLTMALGTAATMLAKAERIYMAVLSERISFLDRVRHGN